MSGKWGAAGGKLEQRHSETVDVGTGIGRLAEQHFGCHVDRRADNLIARLAMRFRELFAGNRQPFDRADASPPATATCGRSARPKSSTLSVRRV